MPSMPAEETIQFEFSDVGKGSGNDPEPGRKTAAKKSPPKPPSTGRRKTDIERELEVNIYMLTSMSGQLWTARDDGCGPVLVAQSQDIASALAEMIAKRPELARKLLDATNFSQYMKLFMAVMPVVRAIGEHHIAPAREKIHIAQTEREQGINGDGTIPFPR